ncbi:MAG: hypothetical protein H8E75_06030 [Puniceicoccaceae bacterium]|nr:hypothetical protein [Puniceicoccaceae bacterium]
MNSDRLWQAQVQALGDPSVRRVGAALQLLGNPYFPRFGFFLTVRGTFGLPGSTQAPFKQGLQHPTRLFARLKQTSFERLMRTLVDKQILSVIPTIDHMIDPALALNP